MSKMLVAVLCVLGFLLSGCATTAPRASIALNDTQQDLLERWQAFSDRVLDNYHMVHVRLIVQSRPDTEGVMATSVQGHYILIDPRALRYEMLPGLSHELGHVLIGKPHGPQGQLEKEANYRAVEILEVGRPETEEAAFREMVWLLEVIAKVRVRLGTQTPRFHNACDELVDLEGRFPQYRTDPLDVCAGVAR